MHADEGNTLSGVQVPTTIMSMSPASTSASAIARRAAASPIEAVVSWSPAMCRCRMPVRSRIHSSDVSIVFSRSSFVTTFSGR